MKAKGLFDAVAGPDDDAEERTFFPSLKPLYEPVRVWFESKFGEAKHSGTWKLLKADVCGVTVRAEVSELLVTWWVGYGGDVRTAGVSRHGDDLDAKAPGVVRLAADYVKRFGGAG